MIIVTVPKTKNDVNDFAALYSMYINRLANIEYTNLLDSSYFPDPKNDIII